MIKIAVCDDEKIYSDLISQYLQNKIKGKNIDFAVEKFTSSVLLSRCVEEKEYDVLFLDIDMPGLSGFDLSKIVRNKSKRTYIVYVTSKNELVYDSFEYTPFYFICKTNTNEMYSDIDHVMDKILDYYVQEQKILINDVYKRSVFINLKNIMYIQSDKHYLLYYAENLSSPYTIRATLSGIEEEYEKASFLRIHQRYLVNMNYISIFDGRAGFIVLKNGERIPISSSLREKATKEYMMFKRR